jgi:hypothetical protein
MSDYELRGPRVVSTGSTTRREGHSNVHLQPRTLQSDANTGDLHVPVAG